MFLKNGVRMGNPSKQLEQFSPSEQLVATLTVKQATERSITVWKLIETVLACR